MLFRSIKTIKVQTSSADKTAAQQRNTVGWHLRSRGLSRAWRKGKKRSLKSGKERTKKTWNLFEVVVGFMESLVSPTPKKSKHVERSVLILVTTKKKNCVWSEKVGVCLRSVSACVRVLWCHQSGSNRMTDGTSDLKKASSRVMDEACLPAWSRTLPPSGRAEGAVATVRLTAWGPAPFRMSKQRRRQHFGEHRVLQCVFLRAHARSRALVTCRHATVLHRKPQLETLRTWNDKQRIGFLFLFCFFLFFYCLGLFVSKAAGPLWQTFWQ